MHTKHPFYKTKRFWAGGLLAQFVLFFIFSKIPFVIQGFDTFFEYQKRVHQKLFSRISLPIGDVFYCLLILGILIFLVIALKKPYRSWAWCRCLILLNVFYFVYQIFWGMLYFQKPLSDSLPTYDASAEEVKHLALKYLERCKTTRTQVKEDENGIFKIQNIKAIEQEILHQQTLLPPPFNKKRTTEVNNFKASLFSGFMSDTGILGYYNPFTSEAQYNPHLPPVHLPFTLAHESTHQLGYAREQEANFIGYLIGIQSDNPELRYSTEYFVLKHLLAILVQEDEDFVKKILNSYSPAMQRDRLHEKEFYQKHQGFWEEFFGMTNHLFLKSNQQEGRITYSYFVDLLLRYELQYLPLHQ
ncbi:hypothetical protein BPO_0714 [Bergeyella porcorum]|uniref:DUF3810 domain-containing protein n=1 Tax=Bergeyella porcorum TaxID=1735111 RepID=A0AAU0EZP7_9FLAO